MLVLQRQDFRRKAATKSTCGEKPGSCLGQAGCCSQPMFPWRCLCLHGSCGGNKLLSVLCDKEMAPGRASAACTTRVSSHAPPCLLATAATDGVLLILPEIEFPEKRKKRKKPTKKRRKKPDLSFKAAFGVGEEMCAVCTCHPSLLRPACLHGVGSAPAPVLSPSLLSSFLRSTLTPCPASQGQGGCCNES